MRRTSGIVSIGLLAAAIVAVGAASASAGSSQYPPRAATCAVAPAAGSAGTSVSLRGTNWSGSSVSIAFDQNGTTSPLTSATVDGTKYAGGGAVPPSAVRGRATIVSTGTGVGGSTITCTSNFQVIDPGHASASVPAGGMAISAGALIAGVGVLFGVTAVRRTRRRSTAGRDVTR